MLDNWIAAGGVLAVLACAAAALPSPAFASDPPVRGTWTTQPATRWESAFLSGNGRMGAMVFGQPASETIVVNHCRMFLPLGSREIVPDLTAEMDQARAAARQDGPDGFHRFLRNKCHELGWRSIVWTDPFHPACMLKLTMRDTPKEWKDYRMSEDFQSGEISTRWTDSRGEWERKLFVSRSDNVMVLSIAGPKGSVGFELGMEIQHKLLQPEIRVEGRWLTAHCLYVKGKGGYDVAIQVVPRGGKLDSAAGRLTVSGADGATILARVVPWKTPLPSQQSEAYATLAEGPDFAPARLGVYNPTPGLGESSVVAFASADQSAELMPKIKASLAGLLTDYAALLAPHAKAHGEMFARAALDLGGGADRSLSTDELLARSAKESSLPPALMERMYDGCRYLAICSSGEVVPNLQGIWTGTWSPAWSGDWTLDSNLQLAMNSMCSANLAEFMEPYARLLESWLPDCRINARKVYGARGIVANTRASNTCLLLHTYDWVAELCICCGGWMGHYLYDSYRFTGDREFLARRAVPYLKETALFYEDLLAWTVGPDGKYRFHISYSPEQFSHRNATIDIAVAREVLTNLIAACQELDVEKDSLPRWKEMLAKMPPYLVDTEGALQEWAMPGVRNSYNQRHHSGLYPLYQSFEFSPDKTPELWRAAGQHLARKTEQWLRGAKPDSNNITHGMIDHAQCAARLGQGEVLHEVLTRLASRRYVFANMMMSYWPDLNGFGFDPVGTMPEVVHNALLFSLDGVVDLLPALPNAWPRGELRGSLARGQLKIDRLAWDKPAGKIALELISRKDQTLTLRMAGVIGAWGCWTALAAEGAPNGVRAEKDIQYVPGDDAAQRLDLFLPEKPPAKPMPLVVWIHGGGWMGGSKAGCPAVGLVAKGYAAASVEYRFSQKALFPAQIQDCQAAIRWLRANSGKHNIDPNHIGVWGASAGGHLVALLGTAGGKKAFPAVGGNETQSDRVQAVCDNFGPADFTTVMQQAADDKNVKNIFKFNTPSDPYSCLVGVSLDADKAKTDAVSPVHYVSRDNPPFLILHGTHDALVPLAQSEELTAALKAKGVDVLLQRFPGSGHGGAVFNKPAVNKLIETFFDKHLKGLDVKVELVPESEVTVPPPQPAAK